MSESNIGLDLSPGAGIACAGVEWTVMAFQPWCGRVTLHRADDPDSDPWQTTVNALLRQPDCHTVRPTHSSAEICPAGQPTTIDDLAPEQREQALLRAEHMLEAETGYRSGDLLRARPDEPHPDYDPATTTVQQRRHAKAAELRRLPPTEARMLGLARVSERTLRRWATDYRTYGLVGCVDGRWIRRSGGRPSISEQVREAIHAVHEETLHRSRVSMKTKERLIHQYVRETFGADVPVPCYQTLRSVWIEWFGPTGGRQRYVRTAASTRASGDHVVVHRPGQMVALDTTILPVKVRETVFGDPVSVHLTLAMDLYTHSLVAFRLTLVSDTSVDVAMLLREVMTPLPLRADWGMDMEWPYPGIPAALVAEFAGHRVAALPFFAPETVTTDHGAVYKNHALVEAQRVIGCNILPARALRPVDKHAVERAFGGCRSLLFEHLLGYTGVDVADRGADPDGDAVLTIDAMEHLVATWVVKIWQNRVLGEYAPAWDPGGRHSPNTLFAAAMAQGGFALQIPAPELYYRLLPAHPVMIHGRRGVKIRSLWYDGPGLDPYRDRPSPRGGRSKGKWIIRRDPRDRRFVYFQDPAEPDTWHQLRWVGLPPEAEVPSFGDARVAELLAEARKVGLAPKTDTELLPLLLDLLGGQAPVRQWPTQPPDDQPAPVAKNQRTHRAREIAQAEAANTDRPGGTPVPPDSADGGSALTQRGKTDNVVVPLDWDRRNAHVAHAVDAERRRRREQAVPQRPAPPPRLGAGLRHRSLLLVPDETADEPPDERDR